MIRGLKRALIRFFDLSAPFWTVLVLTSLLFMSVGSTALCATPVSTLERMRAGRHEGYSSVVFQFADRVEYENPVIGENEVSIRVKEATTNLNPYRQYKKIDSWVMLEKDGQDINVKIGLPRNFLRLKHYFLENPCRLVIDLYEDKMPASSSDQKASKPAAEGYSSPAQPASVPVATTTAEQRDSSSEVPNAGQAGVKNMGAGNKAGKPSPDGDLMTLNFYEIDIQEALSALALMREIDIATSPNVTGKISVHLYQATLDEALNAITLAGGCSYRKYKDLYYVFKPKEALDPQAQRMHLGLFKINYAETSKIEEILAAVPDIRMVKFHEPSKTVIVEDTIENVRKVEKILNFWDTKPKQVLIEAKILEIRLTDDMTFGVNWEKWFDNFRIGTGGFTRAVQPANQPVSPVPGTGSGGFANIITGAGTDHQFTAALDALQSKTKINALSTPKILAVHGKPARVQVGGQQGYRITTLSNNFATETIQFIDTGLVLDITPYIDDNGNVLLKVIPSVTSAELQEGIPVTRTTLVTTWLLANNGETVFIGGLIQDSKLRATDRVPCFGSIPGLGALFGRTSQAIDKTEFVVLITPRIVEDQERRVDEETMEKTRKLEEQLRREPLPPGEQLYDFFLPPEERTWMKSKDQ